MNGLPARLAWFIPTLLAAALAPSVGRAAQEKVRLLEAVTAGDVVETDGKMSMLMTLKTTSGGQAVSFDLSGSETQKYRDQVLAVDEKGVPTAMRRVYSIKRETQKAPGEKEQRKVSPLEGKTIEFHRDGDRTELTVQKGTLPDEERQQLIEEFDAKRISFYPDREVGPGDEWSVDSRAAAQIFGQFEKATVKCHFQDIAEYDGHRCARIHVIVDATGKFEDDAPPSQVKLTGDLYQALDLQRPLAVNMTGSITMKPEKAGDAEGQISGSGTMQARETYRWTKVAGKPVGR